MEKISDTVTSVFHVAVGDRRPVARSSGDETIVWSDISGLGWRFGISHNPSPSADVRLYLCCNYSLTEQDQAIAAITLQGSTDKDAKKLKERVTTITNFGHGQPALLGSWSIEDLFLFPCVSLTLTTKARIPQPVVDPLSSATLAFCQSMETGDLVDTKFYVCSAKRSRNAAGKLLVGKPRVLYANSTSINLKLPNPTRGVNQVNVLASTAFLFNITMLNDRYINGDPTLHEYEYEQDSDLDDEEKDDTDDIIGPKCDSDPGEGFSPKPRTAKLSSKPRERKNGSLVPAYSVGGRRMVLVKGLAYKTWAAYIYFRYTGQVSFLPLKSSRGPSRERPNDAGQPPKCSPKSMYRLASKLGDEKLKELAFRAIKEGLSKRNIVDEAFTWFTAQHPAISEYEVDQVSELRKSPEVSSALKTQMKVVSAGDMPWSFDALAAIMEKLNLSL